MAASLYREIIAQVPMHFDALHMLGLIEYQSGQYESAVRLIQQAIRIDPYYPLAHLNVGNALRSLKRPEEALASYDCALRLKPDYVTALYNRGIALHDLNRLEEALASYDRALALNPDYAEALVNRGVTLRDLTRLEEALASYDRALGLNPDLADAFNNRGNILSDLKRPADALASYDRALSLKPDYAEAFYNRGNALLELKRRDEAIGAYRKALENGGDSEQIKYALAALGAEAPPTASPMQYVKKLFDRYADRFDQHLVGELKYQTPTLLFDAIRRFAPSGNLDILDLGCGTGLFGSLLRPFARTLTGVDLSSNMLEKAQQRQVYDHLICSELTEFLQTQTNNFDLAVAADVFVYIGDLSRVFHGVQGALRGGGFFGFSVEADDGEDFVLRPTRRYAHSVVYLQKLADDHGFAVESIEQQVIRQQEGIDINGYHAIMRCL